MIYRVRWMSSVVPWAPDEPQRRWERAVEVAAHGRYLPAWRMLAPLLEPLVPANTSDRWASLAASTRASHLRQIGHGAAALEWDARALQSAPSDTVHADVQTDVQADAQADALVGAAADALANGDVDTALRGWELARPVAEVGGSRTQLRWHWVGAEIFLSGGFVAQAEVHARSAVQEAAALGPRHRAKTALIASAVSLAGADHDAAISHLRVAQDLLTRGRWETLWWPAALLWLDLASVGVQDPSAEEAIRAGARAVRVIDLHLPVAESALWWARSDVQRILEAVERYPADYGAAR